MKLCAWCGMDLSGATAYETGEPQVLLPASLKRGDPDDPSSVAFTITTIKKGDVVMVKIDNVE